MTITGRTLRNKRIEAGISGQLVCSKAGFARSTLTDIEREYRIPPQEELQRIDAVIDELIRSKTVLRQTAAALGWPDMEAVAR